MARRKDPAPGEWSYTVGDVPVQLTAHERADRGMAIYTRVWDGKKYTNKKALRDSIRDAKGKIIPDEEIAAQRATVDRHRALVAGIDVASGGPLTLSEGFRRLLHKREGKFAADSSWRADIERSSKVIVTALGGDLACKDIRHAHYRKLWRYLAEQNVRAGRFGPRQAEIIVGALRSCVAWLQEEEHIEAGVGMPTAKWKQILRTEWEQITGKPRKATAKPRYTVAEQHQLWAALPKADPRLALAVEIGAELRLGQVARCRRSDVRAHHAFRIGAVQVHGRGKKMGALVVLDRTQRHTLTRAMLRGYLREMEVAFNRGEIEDYYLLPGSRLRTVDGVLTSPVDRWDDAWGTTGLRKAWYRLEEAAGVAHAKGRNWYGLRRLAADLAEDVETDARTLNAIGGWTHTATREGYQQQGRTDIAERATTVRGKIRPNTKQRNDLQQNKGKVEA